MPELPEVQTTVSGLQKVLPKLVISDVWTDLATNHPTRNDYRETIKYLPFYKNFLQSVRGSKVLSVERKAKIILIHLSNDKTILIHLKMTGHLLYGKYKQEKNKWIPLSPEGLKDPFNRFIHLVFYLNNGKFLAMSDARKFGKVTLLDTKTAHETKHLVGLGPDPTDKKFTSEIFIKQLLSKSTGKIKSVLMDQSILSGIGNIYSDESLWLSGINPEERVKNISKDKLTSLYKSVREVLLKGIDFGGDSMSDYRNIDGLPGNFQHHHNAYRKTKSPCGKRGCKGVIIRKVVGGRSAHFCSVHQKLLHK